MQRKLVGAHQHEAGADDQDEAGEPQRLATAEQDAGPAQKREQREQDELEHRGEQMRREERREDAAEHATGRHPKIELGQVLRARATVVELAVTDERGEEEGREREHARDERALGE